MPSPWRSSYRSCLSHGCQNRVEVSFGPSIDFCFRNVCLTDMFVTSLCLIENMNPLAWGSWTQQIEKRCRCIFKTLGNNVRGGSRIPVFLPIFRKPRFHNILSGDCEIQNFQFENIDLVFKIPNKTTPSPIAAHVYKPARTYYNASIGQQSAKTLVTSLRPEHNGGRK